MYFLENFLDFKDIISIYAWKAVILQRNSKNFLNLLL